MITRRMTVASVARRTPLPRPVSMFANQCMSHQSIYKAQMALRGMGLYTDALDGKWGKNSQAALDASGMTFEQLVPGCTPPVPLWAPAGQVGAPPTVPPACYEIPGFEQAWIAAGLEAAQQASTDAEFEAIMMAKLQELCTPPIDDSGPGLPVAGAPCNSFENKYAAQVALRGMGLYADTLDGKWGKNSQAALDASGMTFEQLAPGCTPPAPKWTPPASGGGGGSTPGDLTDVKTDDKKETTSSAWMWGLGAVVLGLGAAVVITRKKQPYAKNPTGDVKAARKKIALSKARRKIGKAREARWADLDDGQRRLIEDLVLRATNDGDAYRKRDAKLAVGRAWHDLRWERHEALLEDFRTVREQVELTVEDTWNRW